MWQHKWKLRRKWILSLNNAQVLCNANTHSRESGCQDRGRTKEGAIGISRFRSVCLWVLSFRVGKTGSGRLGSSLRLPWSLDKWRVLQWIPPFCSLDKQLLLTRVQTQPITGSHRNWKEGSTLGYCRAWLTQNTMLLSRAGPAVLSVNVHRAMVCSIMLCEYDTATDHSCQCCPSRIP